MQLNKIAAFVVYAGSYLPLSMVLLAQDLNVKTPHAGICGWGAIRDRQCFLPFENPEISLSILAFCLLCAALTLLLLWKIESDQNVVVTSCKHVPADLMNYVLPYIVSFMGLSYGDRGKLLGFIIFFLWIFWLTYKSGQVIMNPMLTAFGWRLYEVDYSYEGDNSSSKNRSGLVLSRSSIEVGEKYGRGLLQDVLIFK